MKFKQKIHKSLEKVILKDVKNIVGLKSILIKKKSKQIIHALNLQIRVMKYKSLKNNSVLHFLFGYEDIQ